MAYPYRVVLVRSEVAAAISHETVRQTLKKNDLKLHLSDQQCLRQRLPDRDAKTSATRAGADRRNAALARIDGLFTTTARTKPRDLCPAYGA